MCLACWQLGAPGREALVPQMLPYLLVRALTTGARRENAHICGTSSPALPRACRPHPVKDACARARLHASRAA